jgi:hypothetical protein
MTFTKVIILASMLVTYFNMVFPDDLCIGDFLLYHKEGVFNEVIDIKTASDVDHIEVYIGDGASLASRNGIGVNLYPYRADGLIHVRRPVQPFVFAQAEAWFATVKGAPYGWGDILEQANIANTLPGMDCSHFAACLAEAAGCPQFDENYPKDKITPRDFLICRESFSLK